MSFSSTVLALLANASPRPWEMGAVLPEGRPLIGHMAVTANAEVSVYLVNRAAALSELEGAATAMLPRLRAGKAPFARHRNALYAALEKLK